MRNPSFFIFIVAIHLMTEVTRVLALSLNNLLGINFGYFFAEIVISSPFLGFTPFLAFLSSNSNFPNP